MYGRGSNWRSRRGNDSNYGMRNGRDRRWNGSDSYRKRSNEQESYDAPYFDRYSHSSRKKVLLPTPPPPPPPPPPPQTPSDKADSDEERTRRANKQKTADLVKNKLSTLTEEDKSSSIKELLDTEEPEPKNESGDEKESKRIAHVPKPVPEVAAAVTVTEAVTAILPVPGPILPPPPIPFMLTQHLGVPSDNFGEKAIQKSIERKLLKDLVKTPLSELKTMANKPKNDDNLFLSHLMKERRTSLSDNFRRFAEQRLQDGNPVLHSELENVVDADIAADMSLLSSETMQTLSDIFNMNLDGDIIAQEVIEDFNSPDRKISVKTEIGELYNPCSPTADVEHTPAFAWHIPQPVPAPEEIPPPAMPANESNSVLVPIQTNSSFLPLCTPMPPTFLIPPSTSVMRPLVPPTPEIPPSPVLKVAQLDSNAVAVAVAEQIKKTMSLLEQSKKEKIDESMREASLHRNRHSHKHRKHGKELNENPKSSSPISLNCSKLEAPAKDSSRVSSPPKTLSLSEKLKVMTQTSMHRDRVCEKPKVKMLNMHSQTRSPPLRMNRGSQFPQVAKSFSTNYTQTLRHLRTSSSQTDESSAVSLSTAEVQTESTLIGESKSTQTAVPPSSAEKGTQNVVLMSTRGEQVNRSYLTCNKYSQTSKTSLTSTKVKVSSTSNPLRENDESGVLIKEIPGSALSDEYTKFINEIKSTSESSTLRAQLVKHLLPVLNGAFKSMYSFFSVYDGVNSDNVKKEKNDASATSGSKSIKSSHKERKESSSSTSRKSKKSELPSAETWAYKERSKSPSAERASIRSSSSEVSTRILSKGERKQLPKENKERVQKVLKTRSIAKELREDSVLRVQKRECSPSESSDISVSSKKRKKMVDQENSKKRLVANRPCPASKKKIHYRHENPGDKIEYFLPGKELIDCNNDVIKMKSELERNRDDQHYRDLYNIKNCRVLIVPLPKTPTYETNETEEKVRATSLNRRRRRDSSCSSSDNSTKRLERPPTPNWIEQNENAQAAIAGGSEDGNGGSTISDLLFSDSPAMKQSRVSQAAPILFQAHQGPVLDMKISGNHLLVASQESGVLCYSLKNGKRKRLYNTKAEVVCLSILVRKGGEVVYCACSDQIIRAFSVQTSELIKSSEPLKGIPRSMDSSGTYDHDGALYAGLDTGECLSLNPKTLKVLRRLRGTVQVVTLLSVNIDENTVVIVSSGDKRLMIRNFNAVDLLQKLEWDCEKPAQRLIFHQGFLYCAAGLSFVVQYSFNELTGWSAPRSIAMPDAAISMCPLQHCLLVSTVSGHVVLLDEQKKVIVGNISHGGILEVVHLYKKRIICAYGDGGLLSCALPTEIRTVMKSWASTELEGTSLS